MLRGFLANNRLWFRLHVAILLLLAATLTADRADPRIALLSQRLNGRFGDFVSSAERMRSQEPKQYFELGLDLSLGEEYLRQGRTHDALDAFVRALGAPPPIQDLAILRIAQLHLRLGRPDSAAEFARRGLDRKLAWQGELIDTLSGAVERSGQCQLLERDANWLLDAVIERKRRLAHAKCVLPGQSAQSVSALLALIGAEGKDLVASEAGELLWNERQRLSDADRLVLARSLHHHRRFTESTQLFEQLSSDDTNLDDAYSLARGLFWLERYNDAAERFARIANRASGSRTRARAWFQRGRSLELGGNPAAAGVAFRRSYDAEPRGNWASAALLSALRLEVLARRSDEAGRLYRLLAANRSWKTLTDRAAVFLAASEIAQGQTGQARGWLSRSSSPEFSYWKGRLAELESNPNAAVQHYEGLGINPYHPTAQWASARLTGGLQEVASARAQELSGAASLQSLAAARFLASAASRPEIDARIEKSARLALGSPYDLKPAPVPTWPLWQRTTPSEEVRLATLGAVLRPRSTATLFPIAQPELALAGIDLLYATGHPRDALRHAEILKNGILKKRALDSVPAIALPWAERRLYPRPYAGIIESAAREFDVDGDLLTGLIRQESRFDKQAVSQVSARGLTQFVVTTAEQVAPRLGIEQLTARMLHDPEISIRLGAAHLRELADLFQDSIPAMLGAYNAGVPQARIWRGYCFSDDPAEFWSKVGFTQTKDYIGKVMSNAAHYRQLLVEDIN